MQEKAAAQSMIGDMGRYTQMAAADSMAKGGHGTGMASDMVGLQMGMAIGQQMVNQMNLGGNTATQPQQGVQAGPDAQTAGGAGPKFCPNCGTPATGSKFCGNCGYKLL
jgi:membrane protease subunit (stomatin/prohibitin family)